MKKIPLVLLMLSAANTASAADAIDVQFKGTLTNPTCTATFTGSNGTDLHFPTIKASDFSSLSNGALVPGAPVPGYIKFAACGGGVSAVTIKFVGNSVSGYGFQGNQRIFERQLEVIPSLGWCCSKITQTLPRKVLFIWGMFLPSVLT